MPVHLEVHSLMVVAVKLMEVVSHWSPQGKCVRTKRKRENHELLLHICASQAAAIGLAVARPISES